MQKTIWSGGPLLPVVPSHDSSLNGPALEPLPSFMNKTLEYLLTEPLMIESKDKTMSFSVSCVQFLRKLRQQLTAAKVALCPSGVRLVGSAAAQLALPEENSDPLATKERILSQIHDLDFCIFIDDPHMFRNCLISVEETVSYFLKASTMATIDPQQVMEKFFRDSVMVNSLSPTGEFIHGSDCWSLICLGSDGESPVNRIDFKFIYRLQRRYVFSLDSFELLLDPILNYTGNAGLVALGPSPMFAPSNPQLPLDMTFATFGFDQFTFLIESTFGSCPEALADLRQNRLKTEEPADIRRALFRYCQELCKGRTVDASLRSEYERAFVTSFQREFEDHLYFRTSLQRYFAKRQTNDIEKFASILVSILSQHGLVQHAAIVTAEMGSLAQ